MANKTHGKLGLKKETLRQLTDNQLRWVAGGVDSSRICEANNDSGQCASTTTMSLRIIGYDAYGKPIYGMSG